MPEIGLASFDKPDFKVDAFIKELVQEAVGGPELQQCKTKIQSLNDQISSSLKKHVYENYLQFIDTAKEISHLESDLYQLSHILIEQRNILTMLREELVLEERKNVIEEHNPEDDEEQQNKRALTMIKDSLMNFDGSLDGKVFVHEGGFIELDSSDYRPICRVHLFLFNDALIIAKIKHDKKLEFLTQYEIKKIAVINIKDLAGVKNAINLMTTDGSRIFQCINSAAKNEWLDKFDASINNQPKHKKGRAPQPPKTIQRQQSSLDNRSIASDTLSPTASMVESFAPDWLASSPEEIQAEIAQRHFEEALGLIQKCEDYFAKDSSFVGAEELGEKLKKIKLDLSAVLLRELSNVQSRNLHLSVRSSRRPLKLLIEMGKAREACGILLRVCTTAIRTSQRQARRNNLPVSELFFCDLAQVASEFLRAFKNQRACTSALVVWCNVELQYFASQLIKHYLTKETPLDVVARTVEGVREPCSKLTKLGLDLSYHMEGLLRNTLEHLLGEAKHRLLEPIGRTEDVWQPYNLQTKSNLRTILKDFEVRGVDFKPLVTGDTWIGLSQGTVNFCRHFIDVTESCALLAKNDSLRAEAEALLGELFQAQYAVKPGAATSVDPNFVAKNKTYLAEQLLPVSIARYEKICGRRPGTLVEVQMQFRSPPRPKPRSVYQTDVL